MAQPGPHRDDRPPLTVVVSASAAVELYWVTTILPPAASMVTDGVDPGRDGLRPELLTALASFWGGDGATSAEGAFPEVLVLADRADVLAATGFDEVLAGLDRASAGAVGAPALASEPAADRAVILERLGRLHSDRSRRRAWLQLLAAVAAAIRPTWDGTGADLSRRAARARASQLPWTDPFDAVLGWARRDYDGLLPDLLEAAARHARPVLVVPAYWSGRGLLFDLEDHLLVGIPAQLGPSDSRARTQPWVRGLKALADPTRLAMLDHLAGTPRRISELAVDFGLAQPTTSRHVRLLREGGLVAETRRGSMVLITVDTDGLRRLLDGLADALIREGPSPAGAPPAPGRSDASRRKADWADDHG